MKKLLFSVQVLILALAFPVYFLAEMNHGEQGKAATSAVVQADCKAKPKLYVILKMPAAPEYQLQLVSE